MGFQILIVDDQHNVRRVLASGLHSLGQQIEVTEVPSAEEAMLIAPRRKFDLIITDVRLPGMSGLDLVSRLKLRNPEIKLILMTGAEDRQTRQDVESAGAFAFFYKPIEMSDFLDAVERALGLVGTTFPPAPLDVKLPAESAPQATRQTSAAPAADSAAPPLAPLLDLLSDPDVHYAALLKLSGESVSHAGGREILHSEPAVLPALLAAVQAAHQLSAVLRRPQPDYAFFVAGEALSLSLVPVGKERLLLLAGGPSLHNDLARIGAAMRTAGAALLPPAPDGPAVPPAVELAEDKPAPGDIPAVSDPLEMAAEEDLLTALAAVEVSSEEIAAIDDLFGASSSRLKAVKNLDDFWDSAAEEAGSLNLNDSQISYDEARDLGLAPE